MEHGNHRTDVCIVGAGPVGLFAVFECGMLAMRTHVVDALEVIGGQCSALYSEKPIYDIPGYPRIDAGVLVERLADQAAPFEPVYHLSQQVKGLTANGGGRWLVETTSGTCIDSAAVLIAAGGGAFGPNRPPIPGIADYEESGAVRYLVARREDLRDKRIVIAGGGDSAVDWALSLHEVAARVMVVHRRERFRAAPGSGERLRRLAHDGKLELVIPYQLAGLEGEGGRLAAVVVESLEGERRRLEADVLLPFFGLAISLGPLAELGLALERGRIVVESATCETNLSGVHAIGDVASYPGKLKLILSGFSEAAMAAHAIFARVHPDQELHFEYSTMKGVPGLG